MLALPALRTYSSAGNTASSHSVMDVLKLATITVSATARLNDATTPLTATAALPRTRRARSTAKSGKAWRATSGATRSSTVPTNQGRPAMPPTRISPTLT